MKEKEWLFLGVGLVVGLLTLFSMVKIWSQSFWKDAPEGSARHPLWPGKPNAAIFAFCALTMVFSLYGKFVFGLCGDAAASLHDPRAYIEAVLGGGGEK